VRDYLAAVLPGLANTSIKRLAQVTPYRLGPAQPLTSTHVHPVNHVVALTLTIDYGYREDGAVYMLLPSMEAVLKQQVGTSGNKVYPEMADQKLLGYNYVVNVDQPYAAASVGVAFGSFRRAILVQSLNPILLRSVERYVELSQMFYAFFHRMGVKLVDGNAVTALKVHA